MKILKENITMHTEREIQIANYSAEDIKRLIVSDMNKQGYETTIADISFVTDWKNVSDEWGMNTHTVITFNGAKVKVN
ncbi:MAG: hypothetical protein WC428_07415 [Candidatus Paceibacterota bacterium]